ncbi:SagB/ThcOx family dehydrogenase [Roseateles oligotrophus]|nr:SagB/ThcOx family dehydrogenase [Roseateles oligotrophus]
MNTLTKLARGLMGRTVSRESIGDAASTLALLPPELDGGLPLMQALQRRQSQRDFSPNALPAQSLSNLLWAAAGVNRPKLGGRTAPSAMNAQEIDLYVALPEGLYRFEAEAHQLRLQQAKDVRAVTGYQDFVDTAPLDLIFVADHRRMMLVPAKHRNAYANAAAGAMAQNVYLYCASAGLATVIRAWIDHDGLSKAMGLTQDEELLLAQTVGMPA